MVIDHSTIYIMKEVAVSEFKAKCLGLIEEVRKTRKPIRLTRFGAPVAQLVPEPPEKPAGRRLGCGIGTGEILGDIVGSISPESEWDATR